jgi:hypothetical protein
MQMPDEYRDDRMYVMRISSNFDKSDGRVISAQIRGNVPGEIDGPVLLITYRNTYSLPAVRTDEFATISEALSYIQRVEPTCPRISLGGKPALPTPTWEAHLEWLHSEGLKSVAEGDRPVPHWVKDSM